MDRERHQRLMGLFEELVDAPEEEQRRRLTELRAEDAELAEALTRMIVADGQSEQLEPLDPTRVLVGLRAAAAAPPPPPPPPRPALTRIGHYRLERKLGAGGMGEVYAGLDERLGRRVAIKLLPEDAERRTESRMRMLREAQAASALNHPGIVTLFDIEASEGRLYLVMELVDGESFHALAERGVTPAEALRLVAEAAEALGAAHAAGVLHRDIKSENLMRTRAGKVKVLDFGVAKIAGEAMRGRSSAVWQLATGSEQGAPAPGRPASPLETRAGIVMGTPSYLAPELTHGDPPTVRSEVFALGVVLYELLTGVRPFARGSMLETLDAVRDCRPLPPSQAARAGTRIDEALDALVLRALAPSPADRFADMAEMAAAIRALEVAPARRWLAPAAAGGLIAAAVVGLYATRGEPDPALGGPARRLTFEPGCEEFPGFTGDPNVVVFDGIVDGDYELQTLDLTSGARRRLTRTPGWDYGAAVSPDGARVAYVHQGESGSVRVLPLAAAEEARPVVLGAADGYPAWSADGRLLLAIGDRVRAWDGEAGLRDVATVPAQRRAVYLAAYPDGKVAALLGTTDQEVAPAVALLDGERVQALEIADAAEYPIAASPSGKGLYYQRNAAAGVELVRRPRGGGRPAVLEGGVSAPGGLAFAPGGRRLVYSTCRSTSYVARIAGGRAEPLTRAGAWTDGYPVALDARHLLFTSDRAGRSQVWRLDLDGGAAEPLTPGGTLRAAVSPDRRRLAWTVLEPPGIVVAELGALGAPRRLTEARGDTGPHFTHDGANLVFVRLDEAGGERAWVVPVAGGAPRPLTPPGAAVVSASPAADEVLYLSARGDAGVEVLATDLAGRAPSVAVTLPAGAYRSLRHAPDGKRLLVIREDQEILEIDRGPSPPAVTSLWRGGGDSVTAVDYAPDGRSLLASVVSWEGDLWIVEGRF